MLISFISLPLIIMGIMYFSNENFKDNANQFLSTLPGNLGGYFQSIPTKDEKESIKKVIAKSYLDLDHERIVDKLLIIKGEDQELYNDLIVLMNKENPKKMANVKEDLRLSNFNIDPLSRILNEIKEDSIEKINTLQKYYTSLNLAKALKEIERTHANNEISIDELAILFQNLKTDLAADYLYYLDEELTRQIQFKLPHETLIGIEKELEKIESDYKKLLDLTLLYENKTIDEEVTELGNDEM